MEMAYPMYFLSLLTLCTISSRRLDDEAGIIPAESGTKSMTEDWELVLATRG